MANQIQIPLSRASRSTVISPADIALALQSTDALRRAVRPNQLARARDFKTTARREQALIAVARDALEAVLCQRHGLKNIQPLTRAIRAGHQGQATDFDAINAAARTALGI